MDAIAFLVVFAAAAVLIGGAVLAMAVGVMFSGKCLRGSCGGPDVLGADGKSLACATCPNRHRHRDETP